MSGPRIPRLPERTAAGTCRLVNAEPPADLMRPKPPASRVVRECDLGRNDGTIDPSLIPLLRGAARVGELASEPEHYRAGYVAGKHSGLAQGLTGGIVIGAAVVAAALRLGAWLVGV